MAVPTPIPARLLVGDKEVELAMAVPSCGPETLLTDPLEVIVARVGDRAVLALGPAGADEGWGAADLARDADAARRAAEEGLLTVVLRDLGGTDMAGRPHDVVMGFRSVVLELDVAEAIAAGASDDDEDAPPPPELAAVRAGAVARQTTG